MKGMRIAFFGSSLLSAYWNGAATYYRGILHALARRGHLITFYEPDAFDRQQHRDMDPPAWARVHVYPATRAGVGQALDHARGADLVVKASGVGVFDSLLEQAVLDLQGTATRVAYWDVDAPATLERIQGDPADSLRACIPRYDLIFTYGGGPPVVRAFKALGARECVPIYNALAPSTHHPEPARTRFRGLLGFLGNRLPDREQRVDEFFFAVAEALPGERMVLGGNGWGTRDLPDNVAYLGHVYTRDHNAFNCSVRAVLNIHRDSMVRTGYSPATRLFEAAGAGACLITDAWEGIEQFLEPGREILVAQSGGEVVDLLRALDPDQARVMGRRARARVLAEHTYERRAADVEAALGATAAAARPAPVHDAANAPARQPDRSASPGRDPAGALDIVILGLSITSSWGNGHATTYRSLMRELCARGHRLLFLERDAPWYADSRDLPRPPYGHTALYSDLCELERLFAGAVRDADVVIVGSYVPEGVAVGKWVQRTARGLTAFYDIDTPVTLAGLEAGDCPYLTPDLIPHYDMYLSFTGGPILRRVAIQYGAPQVLPLYCSVDPQLYHPARTADASPAQDRAEEAVQETAQEAVQEAAQDATRVRWDLGYMGTYSDDRQPALERLLIEPARTWPEGRFVVAGPQYPDSIVWPPNVQRIEHLPPGRHCDFYNALGFALNITRRDMLRAGFSPSVRLFEAAACATPIISDYWLGLETFFAIGQEILVARTTSDVQRYLGAISPEERARMGQRARARVLAEHTAAHRAATLERYIRDARASRQSAALATDHRPQPVPGQLDRPITAARNP
jgi:spore maturation protein CgeB